MTRVDLHTHSNLSDGILSPTALVNEAAKRDVGILALTDHDTIAGLSAAEMASATNGIEFIPGVELNTDAGVHDVHILGYYVDATKSEFLTALQRLERLRLERIERIVARLTEIGLPIDFAEVLKFAGPGTIGRPHVARLMIEHGYVDSIAEAFDRYLAAGRPGFVPRHKNLPEDAIRLIRNGGGVPVLAHPLTTGDIEATLHRLVRAGLVGLEVFYGEYDDPTRERLRQIAEEWHLIPTGGSDYHGEGFKHGRHLGDQPVPVETASLLKAASDRIRAAGN